MTFGVVNSITSVDAIAQIVDRVTKKNRDVKGKVADVISIEKNRYAIHVAKIEHIVIVGINTAVRGIVTATGVNKNVDVLFVLFVNVGK